MENKVFEIKENRLIARNTWKMALTGDAGAITRPGQFVNIKVNGFFLRRPLSVCDWDRDSLTLIYKAVGQGTKYMTALAPGKTLDLLTGLGNGFDTAKSGGAPLCIGGGAGLPPLYALAKALLREGKQATVLAGFNAEDEVFFEEEFSALGAKLLIATADGSRGTKGFVTDALPAAYSYVYTCGPQPMLKAVYDKTVTGGQYSFEERMGCGFGACMGCTCKTKYGNKRICKDGPVLEKEEILW